MRDNDEFREDAKYIENVGHKEASDYTGIAGLAILAQLPSIDFPRSFPPDSMHLFFENVVPALVRHYRGVYFKTDMSAEEEATANGSDQQRHAHGRSQKRKRGAATVTSRSAATKSSGATHNVKFKKTSDPWNVAPKVWKEIGLGQQVMLYRYLTCKCDPRSIS
ncbi:MAG TPA: hypothetical protein VHV10_11060 [Ktedonobacteraceae bacterium]|nr:hypothetical protein [Ktedonobacteraceae bacterium]